MSEALPFLAIAYALTVAVLTTYALSLFHRYRVASARAEESLPESSPPSTGVKEVAHV